MIPADLDQAHAAARDSVAKLVQVTSGFLSAGHDPAAVACALAVQIIEDATRPGINSTRVAAGLAAAAIVELARRPK